MSQPVTLIPVLPENAPFSPEQRAYLNGFLAGLYSYTTVSGAAAAPAASSRPMQPLSILYGSQTGTAEKLAKAVSKEAAKHGFAPTIHDLAKYPTAQLSSEKHLLVVTSTYGDGEPPDSAKSFWEFLSGGSAPKLEQTRFSVLSLGDSNYPKFCQFGKDVDTKLAALGAKAVVPRMDCDVDYEEPFSKWLTTAVPALAQAAGAGSSSSSSSSSSADAEPAEPKYSKKNPFPAKLVTNRKLNAPGSGKDVRHFEIELTGSDLNYEVGDALGVFPTNDPLLADEIILGLDAKPDDAVPGKDGASVPLRDALIGHYDINRIPQPFLKAVAERSGDAELAALLAPDANGTLGKFLYGREVIDLLISHPAAKFSAVEFIALLKKLQPRLYSISSSPKAHPGQVHLTVGVVRYETFGRKRGGVCSTFLAERAGSAAVPVFVHENKAFRPPAGDKPLIMCGPGTGIAPFRAYLEERKATGAKGRNWLFFGDQKSSTDFLYREEMEALQKDGLLNRLDLAWSRDQAEKVYVQQRMTENAKELYAWLEDGAGFYVCGDASRMAKDVDIALHKVVEIAGGKTPEQAVEYIKKLKAEKRYQRDVY
jgi:sulfite reductase (NADPH) flavoprotein alpha-component